MKLTRLLMLLALVLTSVMVVPRHAQASTHTCPANALFCDTFETLNLSKWERNWYGSNGSAITKPTNGAETACYDPAQTKVHNGNLVMTLISSSCTVNGQTYPERTGAVTTLHSFSFQDGTLTARAYIPGGANVLDNWATIWTDGFPTWPHNGESDVMEVLGGHACWHYHSDSGAPGSCVTLSGGWHTFAEDVRNGTTKYFYDGNLVGTTTSVKAKHFIIMGNQSGSYGGPKVIPTKMKIDWIQVTP